MSEPDRRVALIGDASFYVGPPLARTLAARDHNLVLGDPAPELVADLEAAGATVVAVEGVRTLATREQNDAIVQAGLARFGRIDAAVMASGRVVTGRFLDSTIDDLHAVVQGCLEPPYHFLQAVLPSMIERRAGQVLIITSASAARPTPGAPLYSAVRAGATHLVRNVAHEMTRHRVNVNAVGTNFMDFPEFLRASGATDPEVRKKVEAQVPLGRLGTLEEFASFCMPFLDGTSTFVTGQFVPFAGGWA
jgi:3-oxoacyl-[acyl-carrier protein] reductase